MKFRERFLAGELEFEEIDVFIVEWKNSDTTETLAKFLGLNGEEEAVWIDESDDALKNVLEKLKK